MVSVWSEWNLEQTSDLIPTIVFWFCFSSKQEGDDYEVVPNSNFYVSRTAYRDNTSVYHISGKKKTFKDVGNLLRSHGIDLDHNRFLILQVNLLKILEVLSFFFPPPLFFKIKCKEFFPIGWILYFWGLKVL